MSRIDGDTMNPQAEHERRQIIRWLDATMATTIGRRYRIDLETLDFQSLRELQRLVRDLIEEKDAVERKARLMPWRFWRPGR
jgi:predicted component of type VI protein secretion system